jgi:hypothetical protein
MTHTAQLEQVAAQPAGASSVAIPFCRTWPGWTLAALNAFAAINSTWFFLGMLKTGFEGWLMMNSCVPSQAVWRLGFALGSPLLMVAGSVMLIGWGTLGLFVFSWSGANLIAQASHILMTLAALYTLLDVLRFRRWRALCFGLLLGLALYIPYRWVQSAWWNARPGLLEQFYNGKY